MGARPSTPRTVQLDNDIPIGVIDVSDDVVQRLKGLHSEGTVAILNLNTHDLCIILLVYVTDSYVIRFGFY